MTATGARGIEQARVGAEPSPGAASTAAMILEGQASRLEVFDGYIAAMARREPLVRAFCWVDEEAARRACEAARGPLAGLPVGVKDIIDTADMPTCYGSPIYAGHRPVCDAPLASMVRRAGGAILGKTVTTEFAFAHAGPTTNPHDARHTPGGSSSGSAAAVAAGLVPFAVGSQTAGSIIRPAAFCGVAGFKPSFGLLPTANVKCFSWTLDTAGLFAATVADVGFFASALTGLDLGPRGRAGWTPRIGVVAGSPLWGEPSAEMQQALRNAAALAVAAGAQVGEARMEDAVSAAYEAHFTIQDFEFRRALGFELEHHEAELSPALRRHLVAAAAISGQQYLEALAVARRARALFANVFEAFDVLLTPSAIGAAPLGLESTGTANFNRLWTVLGAPCVNVPGLVDDAGLPLGVQIVAPVGGDGLALEAAAWLEAVLGSADP